VRWASSVLDRLQRAVAASPALVRLAVLVRNQCRCVIKYHLSESPDTLCTGEAWLRTAVAPGGSYFVDVGANVGDWTAALLGQAGPNASVVAYEPSRSAFARLSDRFARESRVIAVASAVGDGIETATFFEECDAGKGSSFVPGFARIQGTNASVAMTTLDAEMARLGWPRIDLLKIDAEGFDCRVIAGAERLLAAHAIGIVQFEYNRSWQLAGDTLRRAFMLLERFGYATYLLKRDGLYTLDYALYEEYFEYSNYVALAPEIAPSMQRYLRGPI
jgi:FkbM family methyltransferase